MKRPRNSESITQGDFFTPNLPTITDTIQEQEESEEDLFTTDIPSSVGEKKRRLSLEQVRSLEKNFEVENKLDPERKVRIALDLGLQPRQVAVWFQNRRARWKTKQLERDYSALRKNYESLATDCDSLRRDKEILLAEIKEFRAKLGLGEEESESKMVPSEEIPTVPAVGSSDSDNSSYQFPEVLQSLIVSGVSDFQLSSEWRIQRNFFPKEEQNFLAGEENSSDFFQVEQNSGFGWYCCDNWS